MFRHLKAGSAKGNEESEGMFASSMVADEVPEEYRARARAIETDWDNIKGLANDSFPAEYWELLSDKQVSTLFVYEFTKPESDIGILEKIGKALGDYMPVSTADKKQILPAVAKTRTISLRINEALLQSLKQKVADEGLPYQTLILSELYRFAVGRLMDKAMIRKAVAALKRRTAITLFLVTR
jgi:predicted DNA binding CopG/RHH family protein